MKSRLLLLPLLTLLGCLPFSAPQPNPATARGLKINATLTRAFLKGSDYERYAIADGVLYQECGSISKGNGSRKRLPGDELLPPHPDLKTIERRVEKIAPPVAGKLIAVIDKLEPVSLPAPGANSSLKEPGKFEISIIVDGKKQDFITSVDAVSSGQTEILRILRGIASALRSSSPPLCGQRTFFGI